MNNLHAVIHEAVSADTSHLMIFERSSRRSGADWDHKVRYEFDDGAKVELSARFSDGIVCPARPGFELLTIERRSGLLPADAELAQHVSVEPVLAWTLEYDHGQSWVEAITTTGYTTPSWARTFKAIRLPDGRVQWHVPFDTAACSILDGVFGPDRHRDGPVMLSDSTAWLGLVRRVWEVQMEKEKEKEVARNCCASCGRATLLDRDGELPF